MFWVDFQSIFCLIFKKGYMLFNGFCYYSFVIDIVIIDIVDGVVVQFRKRDFY